MTPEQHWILTRVRLAEIFTGWTLEYIDSLSQEDVIQILAVREATHKAQEHNRKISEAARANASRRRK